MVVRWDRSTIPFPYHREILRKKIIWVFFFSFNFAIKIEHKTFKGVQTPSTLSNFDTITYGKHSIRCKTLEKVIK